MKTTWCDVSCIRICNCDDNVINKKNNTTRQRRHNNSIHMVVRRIHRTQRVKKCMPITSYRLSSVFFLLLRSEFKAPPAWNHRMTWVAVGLRYVLGSAVTFSTRVAHFQSIQMFKGIWNAFHSINRLSRSIITCYVSRPLLKPMVEFIICPIEKKILFIPIQLWILKSAPLKHWQIIVDKFELIFFLFAWRQCCFTSSFLVLCTRKQNKKSIALKIVCAFAPLLLLLSQSIISIRNSCQSWRKKHWIQILIFDRNETTKLQIKL